MSTDESNMITICGVVSFRPPSRENEDGQMVSDLDKHLSSLGEGVKIEYIQVSEWDIHKTSCCEKISNASIVFVCLSPDLLSHKSYSEIAAYINQARIVIQKPVVPIHLRPCDLEASQFGMLRVLPSDKKSVKEWSNTDQAYLDIEQHVKPIVISLRNSIRKSQPIGQQDQVSAMPYPAPFVSGGQIAVDRRCYVERICDTQVIELTNTQAFVVVQGEYQIGKSSLLLRTEHKLRRQWKVALLKPEGMRTDREDLFFDAIFKRLSSSLGTMSDWGDLNTYVGTNRTVLMIDEFGKIGKSHLIEKTLASLYWIAEQNPGHFCCLISLPVEVADLCKMHQIENPKYRECWASVVMPRFNWSEVVQLVHMLPENAAKIALQSESEIMNHSEGHPCKVQRLCLRLFDEASLISDEAGFTRIIQDVTSYARNY